MVTFTCFLVTQSILPPLLDNDRDPGDVKMSFITFANFVLKILL